MRLLIRAPFVYEVFLTGLDKHTHTLHHTLLLFYVEATSTPHYN